MAQENKITIEEVFGKFNLEMKIPYFSVYVTIYDIESDFDLNLGLDVNWGEPGDGGEMNFPTEKHYYCNEAEMEDAKDLVVNEFNKTIDDIYNNTFPEIFKAINFIKNDYDKIDRPGIFNGPLDIYKIYVSIFCSDLDRKIYVKYIDIFEGNKDIITLPIKNAKKTK